MSSAKDLGTRHICWKCEAKFYDLNKPSPACPKCGADPRESPALKLVPKPTKAQAPKAPKAPKRVVDEDADDLDDDDFDDLDDDPDEDDDLGDTDDDLF